MSRVYDNWERLVAAVIKREQLRQISLCDSFSSSISSDFSSRFSFDSSFQDVDAASSSSSTQSYDDAQPILFKDLKKATRNFRFDFHFGEGGFGTVYKGWLNERTLTAAKPGSGMPVAVKKWKTSIMDSHEWLTERNYLNQLRHPNLIKLIAYCSEEDNFLLVYELMKKGSLENHLFQRGNISLPWATRIKVVKGAARGLSFLHDLETPVIHRDFKAAKILLDEEFNAKLCGLGLARDGPTGDMTHVSTRVLGTHGYMAPEYATTGHLTVKCDVFSFGIVLLELLSGRRAIDIRKEQVLLEWAAKPYLYDKTKFSQIMDPKLESQYPLDAAYTVGTLALQCINLDPKLRPQMSEVVTALDQL
ncbi:hypothetical protein DH2020_012241 [Rehmannia glutinosa]|uniref:Protein kinase domain-containing protein n=1 Tax=Rehmannia glutinosa TaxID=99300 RepID=A0ABR0WYT4_REHGL